jgi:hypothetical protein
LDKCIQEKVWLCFLLDLLFFIQVWDEMFANLSYFMGAGPLIEPKRWTNKGVVDILIAVRRGHPQRSRVHYNLSVFLGNLL